MTMRVALLSSVLILSSAAVDAGQVPAAPEQKDSSLRTAWGVPDLQGVWDFSTLTRLERPAALAGRAVLTDEEVAAAEQRARDDPGLDRPPPPGSVGGYNEFWISRGKDVVLGNRTSLIVDPPDGRLPSLQPGAKRASPSGRQAIPAGVPGEPLRMRNGGIEPPVGPEARGLAERCLVGINSGPPMMPDLYNNHMQLFQTPGHVVIFNEMVHDVRIVPLDDQAFLPSTIRQWMGSSRGWWDGDTLVVASTNFTEQVASFNPGRTQGFGSGETLHLVERFTRLDDDTLRYEYTVNDPVVFTGPFTAVLPMSRMDQPVFEYACHEGNYALVNMLRGARLDEAAAR